MCVLRYCQGSKDLGGYQQPQNGVWGQELTVTPLKATPLSITALSGFGMEWNPLAVNAKGDLSLTHWQRVLPRRWGAARPQAEKRWVKPGSTQQNWVSNITASLIPSKDPKSEWQAPYRRHLAAGRCSGGGALPPQFTGAPSYCRTLHRNTTLSSSWESAQGLLCIALENIGIFYTQGKHECSFFINKLNDRRKE